MSLTVDQLLAALEPLSYPNRLKHLARTVRSLPPGDELTSLLMELASRGTYERRLAAFAALVGRQLDFLAERLTDRDPVVRAYALRAARTLPLPDAAIEAAYEDASADARQRLSAVVLASGRTALAERLVPRLRERWGDHAAAKLLPVCSARFVAAALPELSYAVESWTKLGLGFPDQVLDHVERELADRPRAERDTAWHRYEEGIAAAVSARAERVLSMLERQGPDAFPAALVQRLNELVAVDAERVVRLLTVRQRGGRLYAPYPSTSVLRRIVQADPPSLPALGRHWADRHPHLFAGLLKALPPHRRSDFFDLAKEGVELGADDVLPVLAVLPRERRWAESRRWAARRRETGRPWYEILELVAYGPVAEARAELLAVTRRPDADDRALAWPLLIANAARSRDRDAVHEMLNELLRLRNEQDPVRGAALGALADVRSDLFTAADTQALDRVLRDALEARDISYGTRQALRRLAVDLLRENAGDGERALLVWSLGALEKIAAHVGVGDLGPLDRTLRRGQEHLVLDALRPWLDAAMNKADYRLLFTLTSSLGVRAHRMPVLQELLEEALKYGDDGAFASAASYWLEPPSTRDARVARILELEPSAAVLDPVERVLTARRTDLLNVLLGGQPPYGRFLRRGTRRPLPQLRCAERWLPRQQAAAGALAAAAAGDKSQPLHSRAAAIRAAAAIPGHGRALALRYAESPEVVLAEAALGALVWTDDPQDALPVLLAHVGGDRARVAVYAASRAARFVAPSQLAERLEALLTAEQGVKVTSRKEAVRLAATLVPLPARRRCSRRPSTRHPGTPTSRRPSSLSRPTCSARKRRGRSSRRRRKAHRRCFRRSYGPRPGRCRRFTGPGTPAWWATCAGRRTRRWRGRGWGCSRTGRGTRPRRWTGCPSGSPTSAKERRRTPSGGPPPRRSAGWPSQACRIRSAGRRREACCTTRWRRCSRRSRPANRTPRRTGTCRPGNGPSPCCPHSRTGRTARPVRCWSPCRRCSLTYRHSPVPARACSATWSTWTPTCPN